MFAAVVAISIVIRLGVIEALLRFYYKTDEVPGKVVATSFASLFWAGTLAAVLLMPFAGPISGLLLGTTETELARVAIAGLWVLTLSEYLLTLFRLDERATAFFTVTMLSVLITIPVTIVLVVVLDLGAVGLLLGSYGSGAAIVLGLIFYHRRRLSLLVDRPLFRRMMRFGLPTMPAELSLYSLSFVDRIIIARSLGLAEAGLYSLAVKISQSVNVLVRGFQLAFPPLAYSIIDDDEARNAYSAVVTWFVVIMAGVVTSIWLTAPWIVRIFAAPEFFDAQEAVGPVAAGTALYALYMVLLVVLGRTGRTEFNFPATLAGVGVNIGLNLLLVPIWGIVGAGVSLVISYAVVLVLMYFFTQRLFPVPYEWMRLVKVIGSAGAMITIGLVFVPDDGLGALAIRLLLIAAVPAAMVTTGFFSRTEWEYVKLLARPRELAARIQAARVQEAEAGSRQGLSEVYEVEQMNEDMRNN
jgi:O-antigen/teichoic acid export membrane protein